MTKEEDAKRHVISARARLEALLIGDEILSQETLRQICLTLADLREALIKLR